MFMLIGVNWWFKLVKKKFILIYFVNVMFVKIMNIENFWLLKCSKIYKINISCVCMWSIVDVFLYYDFF